MSPREALRIEEREAISRELSRNRSARFIGAVLGRHHSTVSREINRNGGRADYRAVDAQRRCDGNRARPKERRLEASARLHDAVNDGLTQKWSPKQISRRLRAEHPDDEGMQVSHETVYECLYLQARGELRTQLKLALRKGRTRRVNRARPTVSRGTIPDMVTISERPAEADDRAVPGFWEGDLIIGRAADRRSRRWLSVVPGSSCWSGFRMTAPRSGSRTCWRRRWRRCRSPSATA